MHDIHYVKPLFSDHQVNFRPKSFSLLIHFHFYFISINFMSPLVFIIRQTLSSLFSPNKPLPSPPIRILTPSPAPPASTARTTGSPPPRSVAAARQNSALTRRTTGLLDKSYEKIVQN
jgi:hypothetical protein